jgi:hypothetical protein
MGDPMKIKLLLLFLVGTVASVVTYGQGGKGDELDRRSTLGKIDAVSSFPRPFIPNPNNNPRTSPPVSTGYYIVDSDDNADPLWKPYGFLFPNNEVDLSYQPETWRSIVTGGHQFPPEFWNGNSEGRPFFQNIATRTSQFIYGTDSTDDAFAGPMPIGFPYYFNGVRYDSFYVSTNGMIALSNRRYFYGEDGSRVQREISPGNNSFYDPESEDTRPPQGTSGLDDPTPDDYGYRCVALGRPANNSAISENINNQYDGIRSPLFAGGSVNAPGGDGVTAVTNFTNQPPIIMPSWGNTQISVYSPNANLVDNLGRVFYKRSVSGDKLIIWFQNVTPRGPWQVWRNTQFTGTVVTYPANVRQDFLNNNAPAFISASYAVVLNRLDSSVCVYFTGFDGGVRTPNYFSPAREMFKSNTTMALRGNARHINYNSLTQTSGARTSYLQSSIYYARTGGTPRVFSSGSNAEDNSTPNVGMVVCFKQWKNTVRAVATEYRVRPRDPNGSLDYTITVPSANVNNFELFAGDQRLGGIVPISIFQNLTNDIQGPNGVNYQPQNIKFRARFRIINLATGIPVYNRPVRINSFFSDNTNWTVGGYRLGTFSAANPPVFTPTTPAPNSNGVPPYAYVQVQFPPFEPNEFIDNQIGRFRAVIIAEPVDSSDNGYRDFWPFDDTTTVQLFVMRRLTSFNEDIREFHDIGGNAMPSVLKFVNIGADVVSGNQSTNNPPPPRGLFTSVNNPNVSFETPVVLMNRLIDGNEPPAFPGGDELRSFPIDLRNRRNAVLSLAYHRGRKLEDYPRNWGANELTGPEIRVAFLQNGPTASTTIGSNPQDELRIEFARPSLDQVNNIVVSPVPGAPAFQWNWHPRCCNQAAITDNAAYSIFGGGGFRRGFSEFDKDTALTQAQGLNVELYDDGKDFEWRKIYIPIPDTFINAPNQGAQNFRFRLRTMAFNHQWQNGPPDDADNFYVKNIRILFPTEATDVEAVSVFATWPYEETPASQATQIPIRARIANNTGRDAQAFRLTARVAGKQEVDSWLQNNKPPFPLRGDKYETFYVYWRDITIPYLPGNRDVEVPLPTWNARVSNSSNSDDYYVSILANMRELGGDIEPLNDSTYSEFTMRFGPSLSYYRSGTANAVPSSSYSNLPGKGLNLLGYVSSQFTNQTAYGDLGGSGSGSIAMKFNLTTQDTLFGFQAYFGALNSDNNNIRFGIHDEQGGIPRQTARVGTRLNAQRGADAFNQTDYLYDTVTTYLYPTPIVLPPGEYWASVSQLSSVGFELGATDLRSGLQTTNYNTAPVPGGSNITLYIDKRFRSRLRNGNLINNNRFAFENSIGSGNWNQFVPGGNIPYTHLDFGGNIAFQNTMTRGTWIPMITPYFGNRTFGVRRENVVLLDTVVPVELTSFEGAKRNLSVDLSWETASEKNNNGFYVERKTNDGRWTDLEFVRSLANSGNSAVVLNYAYTDKNVAVGNTYTYRLRQVDLDGTTSFSGTLQFEFDSESTSALEQNSPNPFETTTNIPYNVSSDALVRVDVVDVMGNVVKNLVNEPVKAGRHTATWDGTSNDGASVANGTYIYRLTIGDKVETRKMSVVR